MELMATVDEAEAQPQLAKTKAEVLDNSKLFDVHTWSDHPEVNNFVDLIYEKHFDGRKAEIKKKHLKVVLLDLYVTWTEDPSRVIAYSRNHNDYNAGSRYNELHISKLSIDVVDKLIDAGLVDPAIGFLDRDTGIGRYSRIWPTDPLIDLFREARFSPFDIRSHKDRLTVILRENDPDDEGNSDIEYEPTEETERMSAMLHKYNELLASTFIGIPTLQNPWIETHKDGKTRRLCVGQREKFVRRIFNRGSFDCGGRFWGGWWQQCPKEYREKIFLNDQPTNEIDFSGLHIVMLYADEGVDYWEAIGSDPYEIPVPDFLDDAMHARAVAKTLFLMLLNAENGDEAYAAFRDKAETGSPEKHLKNDQLSVVHKLIENKHPAIAKYFGADVGISLMNRDAKITEIILDTFVQRSIPVLSLHDSYIVPIGYEDYLIETMNRAFKNVTGIPLVRHEAKAMKEQSERKEDLEDALMSWMPYEGLPWQEENELALKERCYPEYTKRYKASWKSFQDWRKDRKGN